MIIQEDLLHQYPKIVKGFVEGKFYCLIKFKFRLFKYDYEDICKCFDYLLNQYSLELISFDVVELVAVFRRK